MAEQHIVDHLDRVLAQEGRHRRIDISEMPDNIIKVLVSQCEPRAQHVVACVNSIIRSEKTRPVYVFFCEDERYGGFVIEDTSIYIVINIGVIIRLCHFCERMMARPQLWPEIDASGFEAFAVAITFECFDLIVRHELAHALLGHWVFKSSFRGEKEKLALVSQALEFVADGHAALWGYAALAKFAEATKERPSKAAEGYRQFHRTRADTLRNYVLSLFFTFRIMDEEIPSEAALANASHPPASFRFNVACIHLGEHFKRAGDTDALNQLIELNTWERGETNFATLLDRTPDNHIRHWTLSDESERIYNTISEAAKTLPPSLFSLGN